MFTSITKFLISNKQTIFGLVVIAVISLVGVHTLTASHAQSYYASVNASTGGLSGPSSVQTDGNGSKYVRFGTTQTGAISFNVTGTKIIKADGSQFVPYGFVLPCPISQNIQGDMSSVCSDNSGTENSGLATIDAAAKYWNANDVRLQVAQGLLFTSPTTASSDGCGIINTEYLSIIDGLVNEANKNGMVATVTLQEEVGDNGNFALPTNPTSSDFWKYMACHYKNNPAVFFSLYNEPSLDMGAFPAGTPTTALWKIWQSGGTAYYEMKNGTIDTSKNLTYLGMQDLVDIIRNAGANNIIIAEGLNHDKDLSGLDPTAFGGQTFPLTGKNLAYGVEPNEHGDSTVAKAPPPNNNISQAENNFGKFFGMGYLIMPEAYLNYYGAQSCVPTSPTDVPLKLNYLKSLNENGMGLIFWEMNGGIAIKGDGTNKPDLSIPTTYPNPTMACGVVGATDTLNNTQGYGQDVMNWYKLNSVRY